jgi:DNA-binding GntR family transcriptional regulator
MHRLEQEGFVASHGRGRRRHLIVAPLTRSDGQEVLFIVGHLEGLAARTAALLPQAKRAAIVRRLRAINDKLARPSRSHGDAARFFDLDIEFHRGYVEGVAGPRLLALYRAIKPQGERYIRLYVHMFIDAIAISVREHEKIIRAIARGDPDAAQKSAEINFHNAAERLALVIDQHGERGSWHVGDVLAPSAARHPGRR